MKLLFCGTKTMNSSNFIKVNLINQLRANVLWFQELWKKRPIALKLYITSCFITKWNNNYRIINSKQCIDKKLRTMPTLIWNKVQMTNVRVFPLSEKKQASSRTPMPKSGWWAEVDRYGEGGGRVSVTILPTLWCLPLWKRIVPHYSLRIGWRGVFSVLPSSTGSSLISAGERWLTPQPNS